MGGKALLDSCHGTEDEAYLQLPEVPRGSFFFPLPSLPPKTVHYIKELVKAQALALTKREDKPHFQRRARPQITPL